MTQWGNILEDSYLGDAEHNFRTLPAPPWPDVGQGGGTTFYSLLVGEDVNAVGYRLSPLIGGLNPIEFEGYVEITEFGINLATDEFNVGFNSTKLLGVFGMDVTIDEQTMVRCTWSIAEDRYVSAPTPSLTAYLLGKVGESVHALLVREDNIGGLTIQLMAGATEFELESNIGFRVDGVEFIAGRHVIGGKVALTDIQILGESVAIRANPIIRFWNTTDTIESIVVNTFGTLQSLANSFIGLTNLKTFDCPTTPNNVTSMRQTWYNCSGLTSFPQIDVARVTDMFRCWRGCGGLTSFPALNLGTVSLYQAFWSANKIPFFPAMDWSNVTSFQLAFTSMTLLVYFEGTLDTRGATNWTTMFGSCINLTAPDATAQADLSKDGGGLWINYDESPPTLTEYDAGSQKGTTYYSLASSYGDIQGSFQVGQFMMLPRGASCLNQFNKISGTRFVGGETILDHVGGQQSSCSDYAKVSVYPPGYNPSPTTFSISDWSNASQIRIDPPYGDIRAFFAVGDTFRLNGGSCDGEIVEASAVNYAGFTYISLVSATTCSNYTSVTHIPQ